MFKGYKVSVMRPMSYRTPLDGDPKDDLKPTELRLVDVQHGFFQLQLCCGTSKILAIEI